MTVVVPKVTLSVVAHRAGVSLPTASKVLNGRPGVSDATRERVSQEMRALGYRPSTARADDPWVGVRRICVLFGAVNDMPYVPEIFNAILIAADEHHMEVIPRLMEGPALFRDVDEWARTLLRGGCQGVVAIAIRLSLAQLAACERIALPLIGVDCHAEADSGLMTVGSANFAGGLSVAEHLLELGHRHIGLIRGPETATFARERAYGFLAGMREAGVRVSENLIAVEPFDYDGGLRAGRLMLERDDRPTAIAANSDGCAIGVIEAARRLGLQVPAELSVTGFDDTSLAVWSAPQLTTVNQPLSDIARVTLRMMNRILDGKAPDSPHIQLATKLVVRASTAPLPLTDGIAAT